LLHRRAGRLVAVIALVIAGLVPATAQARSCGSWDTGDGQTVEAYGYYGATCSFAQATVQRFYAVDGVPTRLTVLGTTLVLHAQRQSGTLSMVLYDGHRRGRYLSVIISQDSGSSDGTTGTEPIAPSSPTYPAPTTDYPGRGSTVTCADGTISHSGGIQGACSWHGGVG
jgi:hypothetical protein